MPVLQPERRILLVRMIADAMVGRLATWLRLLGQDVAFERDIPDRDLILRARKEKRAILTRDREVVALAGCPALFIKSNQIREQVRQVVRHFHLKRDLFTRCSQCNTRLKPVSKHSIKDQVPAMAYAVYRKFWRCPNCRKVYWRGSHLELFRHDLRLLAKPS
jgi:uncharacterized protein with PIN domain